MDPGIGAALIAALLWGSYVFSIKRYFAAYPATVLTVLTNAFAIAWYLPFALSTTTAGDVRAAFTPTTVAFGVGVAVLLAVALVLFLRALDGGDVSYVTPINKVVPVFVLPIEIGLLGAHLAPVQVAGVVVATLAVYVANYRSGDLLDPIRRAATSRPAGLALLSAVVYAVTDVGKRVALQDLAVPTELWVLWVFLGVLLVLLPGAVRAWDATPVARRAELPKFAAAGLLVAGAEHTTSLAFGTVPASIASPIINTQAIVAVVLGGVLLRERAFRTRLVAAFLAVGGVTLIAL